MPNDLVAPRSLAAANPAAARSSASSHEAGRSPPLSRTSGSVSRTCLFIERTFPGGQLPPPSLAAGVQPVHDAVYQPGADIWSGAKNGRQNMSNRVISFEFAGCVPFSDRDRKAEGGSLSGRT